MKVRIPTQGFRLTPAIGAHVHVKLSGMLNKHTEDAVGVDVYLNGLNGPGITKCQTRHVFC